MITMLTTVCNGNGEEDGGGEGKGGEGAGSTVVMRVTNGKETSVTPRDASSEATVAEVSEDSTEVVVPAVVVAMVAVTIIEAALTVSTMEDSPTPKSAASDVLKLA